LGLGILLMVSRASGDTFPNPGGFAIGADGAFMTWCWNDTGSVPTELTSHINYMVATLTNLTFSQSTCTSTTDMRFDDVLVGPDLGLWTCLKTGGDFAWSASTADIECDSGRVQINLSEIAGCPNPSAVRQSVWCEESGHQMGLDHETGCMVGAGCATANSYSAHHLTHLGVY